MKNDVVLFLILISLINTLFISTEVILKSEKNKLKITQADKIYHYTQNTKEYSYKIYKRKLEILNPHTNNTKNDLLKTNQKNFKAKKLSKEESKICNRKNCNFPFGECVDDELCKCLEPYANLDFLFDNNELNNNYLSRISINDKNNERDDNYCIYKRKSQFIAFALEAVFMAGIGHFYLNRLIYGGIKFSLFFILGLIYFLIKRNNLEVKFLSNDPNQNHKNTLVNIFIALLIICLLALQVYDMIMFGTNSFSDGMGIPLISWNTARGNLFMFDYKEQIYVDI